MMGKVTALDPDNRPLSYPAALRRAQTLWRLGKFTWTRLTDEWMRKRDLTVEDIGTMINEGRVVEIDRPDYVWRYKISGKTAGGKRASCVVEMRGDLMTLVPTMRSKR